MNPDCRYYRIPDGRIVSIRLNGHDASGWGVWLDHRFICDSYGSPEEAASCAHSHDFSDDTQTRLFVGVHVPEALNEWSVCKRVDQLPIKQRTMNPTSR